MRLTFDHETFTNHSYVTFCTISILQQCVKILINYLLCFTDFFSSSNVCYLECLIDRGRGPVRSAAACSLPVHEEECDSRGENGYKYQHAKSHIPVVDCPNVLIFLIVQVVENVFVLPNVFLKYVMQSVVCLSVSVQVCGVGCSLKGTDHSKHGRVDSRDRVQFPQVSPKSPGFY